MPSAVPIATGRRFRLRMPSVSEHVEQVHLMRWAAMMAPQWPELRLLHAIPNGGARDARTGRRMRDEGVRRGVPDLCLPVARGTWHGLYLELKRRDGGVLTEEQEWWLSQLRAQNYLACVQHGWEAAAKCIVEYLET